MAQRRFSPGTTGASVRRVTLEFRLLGTLEVEGGAAALGSGKQRAMLAYLLLRRNDAVPREALVDALWGEDPPATAAHALDVYASRVRKTLGGDGLLESRGGSFRLNVPDESVDVGRFERLLAEVRGTPDPDQRLAAADQALALWRGRALADVLDEPFARPESERLEEERLVVAEERFDALLALGRHDETIGELQAFVREHPLRDRPRRELMLALYRAGRQSEALEVYREGRTILQDELGLEPSRELRELEAAILRQDEQLAAPARAGPTATVDAVEGRSANRRRALIVACVVVAVVGASVAAVLLLVGGGNASLARVDFSGVGAVDPGSGRILSEVIPSVSPGRLATAGGAVWTTNQADDTVSGIDTSSAMVVHTIPVGGSASDLVTGAGAVWVANTLSGTVSRIDPGTERVVQTIPVGHQPTAVTFGDGSVWVTNAGDRSSLRDRPGERQGARHLRVGRRRTGHRRRCRLAVGDRPVDGHGRADRSSLPRRRAHDPRRQRSDGDRLRVRIDLGRQLLRRHRLAHRPAHRRRRRNRRRRRLADQPRCDRDATVGRGRVGAPSSTPSTRGAATVARRVDVGTPPVAIAATPTKLWISAQGSPASHRGGTLTMVSPLGSFDSLDPALAYASGSWGVLTMTNDGLVGFRRASGSDGTQVVPDLAASVPTPTDGGTTYRFQLRRGVHYSNGAVVSPCRHPLRARARLQGALARHPVLRRDSSAPRPASRSRHRLRSLARRRRRPGRGTLSRSISRPPTRSSSTSSRCRSPTRCRRKGRRSVPPRSRCRPPAPTCSRITRTQRSAVLVRNPHFHVWSDVGAAARLPGPDRLERRSVTLDTATTAIEQGNADVLGRRSARRRTASRRSRRGMRARCTCIRTRPSQYVFLNTRRPPFNDVRVRQALNYALDRNAIVRLHGGPTLAVPTCQVLPPLIPGYRPSLPVHAQPDRERRVDRARPSRRRRRSSTASGTRGMHITLWSYSHHFEPYATEMGVRRHRAPEARLPRHDPRSPATTSTTRRSTTRRSARRQESVHFSPTIPRPPTSSSSTRAPRSSRPAQRI